MLKGKVVNKTGDGVPFAVVFVWKLKMDNFRLKVLGIKNN